MPMNKRLASALLALALVAGQSGLGYAASSHSHDDHGVTGMELTLNNGQKWQTDEPLRTGMGGIRDTVDTSLPLIHDGSYGPDEFSALADSVQSYIDYIVENCSLPEEADLQLHVALAQMFEGIDALKGVSDPEKGVISIVQALNAYGEHFDHPDWKPIAVGAH